MGTPGRTTISPSSFKPEQPVRRLLSPAIGREQVSHISYTDSKAQIGRGCFEYREAAPIRPHPVGTILPIEDKSRPRAGSD